MFCVPDAFVVQCSKGGSVRMARKAREKSSTGFYAVLLRGEEENIFKTKKNKDLFEQLMNDNFGGKVYDIKFKNDSVTVIVKESSNGLGNDMKPVLISFARTYNRERGMTGKVFKDRFKSLPINSTSDNVDFGKPNYISKPKQEKQKAEKKIQEEPKQEQKKKNDMPTWLL